MKARSSNNCRDGTRVRDIYVYMLYIYIRRLYWLKMEKLHFEFVSGSPFPRLAREFSKLYVKFKGVVIVIPTYQLFIRYNDQRICNTRVS